VTRGAYRFIRHPMYASLLLLAWGIFFKDPASLAGLALAGLASLCLYLTARVEESENLRRFGEEYRVYMRGTKRFIPFLF
jgi:protein-S-isoprenylcysteine O-methyltransferase Ste14